MTESNSFSALNIQNMCRVCLGSKDVVRSMFFDEINCFKTLTAKATITEVKMSICSICGHLLRKFMRFSQQCRNADFIFNQLIQDSSKVQQHTSGHKFITIPTKVFYLGPKNHLDKDLCDVQNEENLFNSVVMFEYSNTFSDDNDDDDELPLMMFKGDEKIEGNELIDKGRKKGKRKSKCSDLPKDNTMTLEIKMETDIAPGSELETQDKTPGKHKRKKVVKEGFSSRMVQETDEYVVIKLTKQQVLEEMQEKSTSEKYKRALYKCLRCVKGFNFEDVLRNHEYRHSKENGEYQCELCTQYCPSAVSLRGHMKSHTTRYKCKVCGDVRLSRQHLLEHHAISHTSEATEYACEHCNFTTNKRTVIQRHVKTHKRSERHACHKCGRMFQNLESLRVHTTRHDKSKSLQCEHCGRKFIYPSLLEKHVQSVHVHTDYYCVECDIRFKSPENLRLHFKKAKRHRDSSSYTHSCPLCSERFVSAPPLCAHLSAAHGHPKKHACELCRRLYCSREALKGHVRRVHGGRQSVPQSCHICKKTFSLKVSRK